MPHLRKSIPLLLVASLGAQDAAALIQGLKSAAGQGSVTPGATDTTPQTPTASPAMDTLQFQREQAEEDRLEKEIQELKTRENAPPRFAADLFELRQRSTTGTEGGIAEDYVLGVGDQVNLNAYGSATFSLPVQVDGRGEVVIPKVGSVKVAGLNLAKAKHRIQGLVQQNFSNTQVDVSVLKLREVRVFVMGEVYKPGSYLVPSLSSLVNVLGLSGGPTASGSFRQIRVMRGGKVIHVLDLYPLRAEGLGNMNFSLQNGDTLFVPLAFNQVSLVGPFARIQALLPLPAQAVPVQASPAQAGPVQGKGTDGAASSLKPLKPTQLQFELLPGESAQDALRYAGGLTPDAYPDLLSLKRQSAEGLTTVQDITATQLSRTELKRGDILTAYRRRDRLTHAVSLTGWARVTGTFGRMEGLRVGDLLKRDRQVLPDTYQARGEILRTREDGSTHFLAFDVSKALAGDPAHNLLLEDRDRIELFRVENMRLPQTVTISGPLTHPGTFPLAEGMRVSDLVFKGGIPKLEANRFYAELARYTDGKVSEVHQLDLSKLVSTEASSPLPLKDDALNPLLQADDQVTLYTKPQFRVHRTVQILGQVARPGSYVIDSEHFTLSDLVTRAGGLTPLAMPRSGIFIRPLNANPLTTATTAPPTDPSNTALPGTPASLSANGATPTLPGQAGQTATVPGTALPGSVQPQAPMVYPPIEPGDADAMAEHAAETQARTLGLTQILERLNETKLYVSNSTSALGKTGEPTLFRTPVLHGLNSDPLNRLVVNFEKALQKDPTQNVEMLDGDMVVIPRQTDAAMVLGEAATPFAYYKVTPGMSAGDLLQLAGGTTRNADTWNIRLLKADGRIQDSWVSWRKVEPGDALLIPQKIRRDVTWQENLTALTPLAILINAIRR
nr:SLBB domain-containing protein [uncultured Holophaga sp.]